MTSPPGATASFSLTPGAAPVPITNAGNAPTGLQLVNRGDNGGTVWIMSGPTGQAAAIPLGPSASMQWTDPAVIPYAYVRAGGTAETLVASDQAGGYTNPATVAAALITQGIPSTMVDTDFGSRRLLSNGPAQTVPGVGQCSTLLVNAYWPQPTPQGQAVLRLTWTDPASPNFAPITQSLTSNNAVEGGGTWVVPVLSPTLQLAQVDTANSDCFVQIVGNNRPAPPRVQILGDGGAAGHHQIGAPCPTAGVLYELVSGYGQGSAILPDGGPRTTRLNGAVTLSWWMGSGGGFLYPNYVTSSGHATGEAIQITPATGVMQWAHPAVPVYWQFRPSATVAGNGFSLMVTQN